MHKECFRAIDRLRKNDDVIITKPDKGSGVVLLNKRHYVDKMNEILDDQAKFKRLDSVSSNDNTASIESRLQKRLLDLVKTDLMPKWIRYMTQYDQLDRKDLECMVCQKHTKKALHFALYCLWQVRLIMNLASGWLAYCNLCLSGFRHIAFQIRLRLLRPCKILTSTLMSSCVLLMCPACSLTLPFMKPSKSV